MDPLTENLKATTVLGKSLARLQIADIQETAGRSPELSRSEPGQTICEHLRWQTPRGSNGIQGAMRLLEELERLGIVSRPPCRPPGLGQKRPIQLDSRSKPQPAIE